MIQNFSLHQPESVEAASDLLAIHGMSARVIAGGSQLVPLLKSGVAGTRHLIDIKRISRLNELDFDAHTDTLTIGASVTHRTLESSAIVRDHVPLLAELERRIGNVRVRNVGTLGGNLCAAEPNSDPASLLLAYNARVRIGSTRGERLMDLADFLLDSGKTALERDELLLGIDVPKPKSNVSGAYFRFCPCERPTVSVALLMEWTDSGSGEATLIVGCVGAKPVRLAEVEDSLRNQPVDELLALASGAGLHASRLCSPADDIWCSADYKRHLVSTFVARAIRQACARQQHE